MVKSLLKIDSPIKLLSAFERAETCSFLEKLEIRLIRFSLHDYVPVKKVKNILDGYSLNQGTLDYSAFCLCKPIWLNRTSD